MRLPVPALFLPLFLTGCALPPVVTVASLVLDGVSYVSTGKSSTDHAISAFAHEDCALLRAVGDKPICDPDGVVLIALTAGDAADEDWFRDPETGTIDPNAEPQWAPVTETKALVEADAVPALTPGPVGQGYNPASLAAVRKLDAPPAPRGVLAKARPAARPPEPQIAVRSVAPDKRPTLRDGHITTFAVVGSFRSIANARRLAESRGNGAIIKMVEIGGKKNYRVLLDQPVEQIRRDGFPDAWPVHLCSRDLDVPPCGDQAASAKIRTIELAAK